MQKRILFGIVMAIMGLDYYMKQNMANEEVLLADDATKKHKSLQIKKS